MVEPSGDLPLPATSLSETCRKRSHAHLPRIKFDDRGELRIKDYKAIKERFQDLETASDSVRLSTKLKFKSLNKRSQDPQAPAKQVVLDLGTTEKNEKLKLFFLDPEQHLEKDFEEAHSPSLPDKEKLEKNQRLFAHLTEEIKQGRVAIQRTRMWQNEKETEIIALAEHMDDVIIPQNRKVTTNTCSHDDMRELAVFVGTALGVEILPTTSTTKDTSEHDEKPTATIIVAPREKIVQRRTTSRTENEEHETTRSREAAHSAEEKKAHEKHETKRLHAVKQERDWVEERRTQKRERYHQEKRRHKR